MTREQFGARFSWDVNASDCWVNVKGDSLSLRYGKLRASLRKSENNGESRIVDLDRLAYMIFKGEIQKSKAIAHSCGNIDCINPEHISAPDIRKITNGKTEKICTVCNERKSVYEFAPRAEGQGRKIVCPGCEKTNAEKRAMQKNKKEDAKQKVKIARQKRKEELAKYKLTPEYIAIAEERKKKYRARRVADWRKQFDTDPILRIKHAHRRRINNLIKLGFITKEHASTREMWGCTYAHYKTHIESQFRDGMTWGNHGSVWELDHIRPLASFNLLDIEEQHKAFHYTNMQPLLVKENRHKSARWNKQHDMLYDMIS